VRIGYSAILTRGLDYRYQDTWAGLASVVLEVNRGRTYYVDNVLKFLNFYTCTFHYWNEAIGLYSPSSQTVFGPL